MMLEDHREVDILWLYRVRDCLNTEELVGKLVTTPCSFEVLDQKTGQPTRKVDDELLKEVFFSCHRDTIKTGTIVHKVIVRFLGREYSQSKEKTTKLKLLPGFLCRFLVDVSTWVFRPLDPKVVEDKEESDLLQTLKKRTAEELEEILAK
eukprot:366113-Chlamydomonas_euryale.AAC.12